MTEKKYYWLKLKNDFFSQPKIKKLRRIAGGDTYTLIYLKLQLLSLQKDGALIFEGIEDSFVEEMALNIDEDVDNVKITLSYLLNQGLLEEVNSDTFLLPETIKNIGSETRQAEIMRRKRAIKSNIVTPVLQSVTQSKSIELEKDTELEKELNSFVDTKDKNLSKAELKLLTKKEEVKKDNEKVLETCLSQFDCFSEKVIDKLFSWKEVIDERNNKQDYSKDLFNFISGSIETMLNNLSVLTSQEQIKRIENSIANPKYNTIYTNNLFETKQTNKAQEPSSGRTKQEQIDHDRNRRIKDTMEIKGKTLEEATAEDDEFLANKAMMEEKRKNGI